MVTATKDHPKIAGLNDGIRFSPVVKNCSSCKWEVYPLCKHPKEGKKGWEKMTMDKCYETKKYSRKTKKQRYG